MSLYIHLEAHKGTWLNNLENEHQINWGTLRCNLDFMECQMKIQGNFMEHTIPTWRYCAFPFPNCQVLEEAEEILELKVQTGYKYSLDIKMKDGMDTWTLGQMVMAALNDPDFKKQYGTNTNLNTRSRRSNGHQGKLDCIEAQPNWPSTSDIHTLTLYNI
jgi:hypothetical protein